LAARIHAALGIEPTLIEGHGGIYEVAVEGEVLARKDALGFPDEDATFELVCSALRAAPARGPT
jgi:predicted Rdx family selenoprotein